MEATTSHQKHVAMPTTVGTQVKSVLVLVNLSWGQLSLHIALLHRHQLIIAHASTLFPSLKFAICLNTPPFVLPTLIHT